MAWLRGAPGRRSVLPQIGRHLPIRGSSPQSLLSPDLPIAAAGVRFLRRRRTAAGRRRRSRHERRSGSAAATSAMAASISPDSMTPAAHAAVGASGRCETSGLAANPRRRLRAARTASANGAGSVARSTVTAPMVPAWWGRGAQTSCRASRSPPTLLPILTGTRGEWRIASDNPPLCWRPRHDSNMRHTV